jgi:hypothetical protein
MSEIDPASAVAEDAMVNCPPCGSNTKFIIAIVVLSFILLLVLCVGIPAAVGAFNNIPAPKSADGTPTEDVICPTAEELNDTEKEVEKAKQYRLPTEIPDDVEVPTSLSDLESQAKAEAKAQVTAFGPALTKEDCETRPWRKWFSKCVACCYNWDSATKKCKSWLRSCENQTYDVKQKKCIPPPTPPAMLGSRAFGGF